MNQMQCVLCVSRWSILSLHHCSAENIPGIDQEVSTLVDKMHSKHFQARWLLLHLVKIFGNVAMLLMDVPSHTAHFWMGGPLGTLACWHLLCKVADYSSGP